MAQVLEHLAWGVRGVFVIAEYCIAGEFSMKLCRFIAYETCLEFLY